MIVTFLTSLVLLAQAFILNKDIKMFLFIFFAIGIGLGLLRLFVNSSIKKMRGKDWKIKVLFFGVLLGLGLPFQNWFRKEILLSMDTEYLTGSITILILGVLCITAFYRFLINRLHIKTNG